MRPQNRSVASDRHQVMSTYGAQPCGFWSKERGSNLLDSGAPFCGVYETADNRYIPGGALEPQLYEELVRHLDPAGKDLPPQLDSGGWGPCTSASQLFSGPGIRDEWCALLEASDACFAPVGARGARRRGCGAPGDRAEAEPDAETGAREERDEK